MAAGDCHIPYLVHYTGTYIIIGTRTVRVLYEKIGGTQYIHDSPSFVVAKLPCTLPTTKAHNHVELKQSISISMGDVGGSSSGGSAAEDDIGSGQQGGSSADPGVDAIELFLPHT